MSPLQRRSVHSIAGLARALGSVPKISVHGIGLQDERAPHDIARWADLRLYSCRRSGPRPWEYSPDFQQHLRNIRPAIVHSHGLWMYHSRACLLSCRKQESLGVISPRGMLTGWALRRSFAKKLIASVLFESSHLRNAACLHATADMEAKDFRIYGLKQPIAILPNGIELPSAAMPALATGSGERTLLFLSRIHPKKGLLNLVEAWRRLSVSFPEWHLMIAGEDEGGHEAQVKASVRDQRVPRVTFPGPAYGTAKTQLFFGADVFVLPTYSENFGIVVAEALAHGVPVVTTNGAPWNGLITHRCGCWVDLTVDALTEALREAMELSDADRRANGEARPAVGRARLRLAGHRRTDGQGL